MNQETNLDKALEAIRNGEFVLVFDDDDREGEVDMIIASEFVTPKSIATMRNSQNSHQTTFHMMKGHHFQYGQTTENPSLV